MGFCIITSIVIMRVPRYPPCGLVPQIT